MLVSAVPQQKSDYWNSYYASRAVLKLSAPSQFAAFVAQEAGDAHLIIEVGCGNGRDSLFFARHGFQVVAIDGSEAAILKCEESRQAQSLNSLSFICASVGDDGFAEALVQARAEAVRRYLSKQGVALNRIATISYGADSPAGEGASKAGREANRRVVLIVLA